MSAAVESGGVKALICPSTAVALTSNAAIHHHHRTTTISGGNNGTQSINPDRIKECIGQTLCDKSKKKIASIINEVGQLSDIEKLLLYLQLPNGTSLAAQTSNAQADPLKQRGPGNPFGKKAENEVAQTYTWIQSHLEEDPTVSLPKHEVYEDYRRFCQASKIEALCVADFGKAMKHVFPKVKPRRLGQRGNSKYCYSGLKMKFLVEPPSLPVLDPGAGDEPTDVKGKAVVSQQQAEAEDAVLKWASKLLNSQPFGSIAELGMHLKSNGAALALEQQISTVGSNKSTVISKLSGNSATSHKTENQTVDSKSAHTMNNSSKMQQQAAGTRSPTQANSKCRKAGPTGIRTRKGSLGNRVIEQSDTDLTTQMVNAGTKIVARTGTPVAITQSPGANGLASANIILLPAHTLPQAAATQLAGHMSPGGYLSSPVINKYKKIQPKPAPVDGAPSPSPLSQHASPARHPINRSCSAVDSLGAATNEADEVQRRRHSVSVPFLLKRPSPDNGQVLVAKKRMLEPYTLDSTPLATQAALAEHFDEQQSINLQASGHLVSFGGAVGDVLMQQANTGTTNKNDGLLNSSAHTGALFEAKVENNSPQTLGSHGSCSRSPTACPSPAAGDKLMSNFSAHQMVQELETNALLEYLNDGNSPQLAAAAAAAASSIAPNNFSSESNDTSNKLSQLRRLLEKNLPASAKGLGEGLMPQSLQGCTELREALLRRNASMAESNNGNPLICSSSQEDTITTVWKKNSSIANTNVDSNNCSLSGDDQSPGSILGETHQRSYQLELLESLESTEQSLDCLINDSQSLYGTGPTSCEATNTNTMVSTPNHHGNALSRPDDLFAATTTFDEQQTITSHSDLDQLKPLSHSVPGSPNTRRRMFCFQPISSCGTPTSELPATGNPLPFAQVGNSGFGDGIGNVSSPPVRAQSAICTSMSQPASANNSPFMSPRSTPVPMSKSRHNSGQSSYIITRVTPHSHATISTQDSGVSSISSSPFISPQATPIPGNGFANVRVRNGSGNIRNLARQRHSSGPGGPLSSFYSVAPKPQLCRSYSVSPMVTSSNTCGYGSYSSNSPQIEPLADGGQVALAHHTGSNGSSVQSSVLGTPVSPLSEPLSPLINYNSDLPTINEMMPKDNGHGGELQMNEIKANDWRAKITAARVMVHARQRHLSSPYNVQPSAMFVSNQNVQNVQKGYGIPPNDAAHWQNEIHNYAAPVSASAKSSSYPATPVRNQSFSYSSSPPPIKTEPDCILSRSDVMVSGEEPWGPARPKFTSASAIIRESNASPAGLNVRRNLGDLLSQPPVEDDLQTTLEDLRDCDNDFSRFAQELEGLDALATSCDDVL